MAADLKLLGDLDLGVIAGAQQRPRLFQIAFLQRLGSAADSSPPASGRPFPQALACFKFHFVRRPLQTKHYRHTPIRQFEKTNPTGTSFRNPAIRPGAAVYSPPITPPGNKFPSRQINNLPEIAPCRPNRHAKLKSQVMQLTAATSSPAPPPPPPPPGRSTGPRTTEGKQKSSQNSTKHGCCSKRLLLPAENPAEWESLKAGWLQEYDTSTPFALQLVMEAAKAQWQQIRARNAFVEVQYAINEEQADIMLWTDEHHKLYSRFERYLGAAERSFLRAFHEIERFRRTQFKQSEMAFKQDLERRRFTLRQDKNRLETALLQAKTDLHNARASAVMKHAQHA